MYELTIKCFLYELWGIAIVIIDEHAYAGYSFFFCNDCNCHTAMNFKDKHLIV